MNYCYQQNNSDTQSNSEVSQDLHVKFAEDSIQMVDSSHPTRKNSRAGGNLKMISKVQG